MRIDAEKKTYRKVGGISKLRKKHGISFPASGGIFDRMNPNADVSRANLDKA